MTRMQDSSVANRPTMLFDLIAKNVYAKNPRPAVILTDPLNIEGPLTSVGYSELATRSLRIASGFASLGAKTGDRIGVILPNGTEFLEAWFASSVIGAVFVPFNFALKGEMLAFQLEDSGVSVLCVEERLAQNLANVKMPRNVHAIVVARRERISEPEDSIPIPRGIVRREMSELRNFDEFTSELWSAPSIGEAKDSQADLQPASILYTSGTTGSPKGVVLTHRAYLNRASEVTALLDAKPDAGDIFLNALPMFHTSGQVMTTLPAFLNGGTVVIEEWFHASRFWKIARKTGSRFSFLLMTMLNSLLKRKESYVKSELERILCGGASASIWREFEESFKVKLLEGFGMTETCGIAIFNKFDDYRVGSIGKPLPSVDAKIEYEGTEKPTPRKIGEICLRPKIVGTMMIGYHNGELEAGSINASRSTWLHTGDVGYVDEDGFFYFIERMKDIIRRRGENIAPSDIERSVSTHPLVLECCAVGEKSELGEEDVVLYLVLKEKGALGDPKSFVQWLDRELPFYMMPRTIRIVEALPKTANQKIQRAKVKEGQVTVISEINLEALGFRPTRLPLG
ncbi:MAG TPA: class I adenylate-forming enzyme family protein [Nitrososphaerales archaeon]|nr:class I adenylate-forming enzyme family protein [Nitrososphaerales archaeon]